MVVTILNERFLLILIAASLIFSQVLSASAQTPEVNSPLESQLYQGSPEKITAFIKRQQEKIGKIITEIDRSLGSNATQERRGKATAVKDLFQGLSLQYKSLLAELFQPSPSPLQKPTVKGPPYKIEAFDSIISFQRQVNVQSDDSRKNLEQLKNRLDSLKTSAVAQLAEYARLKKTAAGNSLELYEKYGQLLITQCEYALLHIKKPKIERRLVILNASKKNAASLVKEVFAKLEITPDDISKAQKLKDKSQILLQKTIDATSAEYQDLNRRFLIYEAQLNDVLNKLGENNKNNLVREGWHIEKERIELILDALKLRIQLVNQKRLKYKTRLLVNTFRLQWLIAYKTRGKKIHFTDFINRWSQELDTLERRMEEITTAISVTTLDRSNLTRKLASIYSQHAAAKTPQIQKALDVLSRQATKVNENIDKLILLLSENDQDIRNAKSEIKQILELTRFTISYSERIRTWSNLHLIDVKE